MTVQRWSGHTVLAAILLAASCAPGSDAPRSSAPPPPPTPDSTAMTSPNADSLQLTLDVRAGNPVRFILRVRNAVPRQVALLLRGRSPTLDVEVRRAGGEVVWRRLEGEVVQAIVQVRILEPGEDFEVVAEWDARLRSGESLAPGSYEARGLLLLEEGALTSPVTHFSFPEP